MRELISERWIKESVLSISISLTGEVLSITFILVAINGILGELGNGVDRSLFVNNLAIYIKTRNQRMALQEVTNN